MHVMRWQQRGIDRFERDKKRWKECRGERCGTNLCYSRHQFFQCVWQELSDCFHIWEIHAIGFACSQLKIHMGGGGRAARKIQGHRVVGQLSPEIPTNGRIEDLILWRAFGSCFHDTCARNMLENSYLQNLVCTSLGSQILNGLGPVHLIRCRFDPFFQHF